MVRRRGSTEGLFPPRVQGRPCLGQVMYLQWKGNMPNAGKRPRHAVRWYHVLLGGCGLLQCKCKPALQRQSRRASGRKRLNAAEQLCTQTWALQWIWSPCAPSTCLKLPEEMDVRRNENERETGRT